MIYTKTEVIEMFTPVVEANDAVQERVSDGDLSLPEDFLKLLSNLDWAIRNYGEDE